MSKLNKKLEQNQDNITLLCMGGVETPNGDAGFQMLLTIITQCQNTQLWSQYYLSSE